MTGTEIDLGAVRGENVDSGVAHGASLLAYADAVMAFDAGAHVFLEKPLAETVEEAERVVAKARETGRKLVAGYILRHHPSWQKFVDIARTLGTPLVMRMNLNQQSSGETW